MTALVAACGQAPAPTPAPAKPTEAPKPAAEAPKPTEAPKPAAAEPTKPAAAAAAPTNTPAAKPAEAPKPAAPAAQPTTKFGGQTVLVGGPTGPAVTSPFEKLRGEWQEKTGAKVELVTFPFADLYDKIRTTIAAGKPFADMYVHSATWAADVMGSGTLLELPKDVQERLNWNDLTPNFRNHLLKWAGKVYGIPYDGDSHMYYYRQDLITDAGHKDGFRKQYGYDLGPATTWDMYRDIAEYFTKTDWNKGGEHFGTSEAMGRKKWSFYTFFDRAAAYGKHPEDPNFFFDPDTMKPRINSPPFVKALEEWKKVVPFGPPGMVTMGYDEDRIFFPGGKAAQTYEWHDIGTLTYDPKRSTMQGKGGYGIAPGAKQVYNQKTKQWENGTGEGGINYAPGLWFGGWIMGVVKGTKVPDATFDLGVFMGNDKSMDENVMPDSGVNPSRYSHFSNMAAWTKAGFDERSAKDYLEAIKKTYEHPNAVADMRIPSVFEYYDILEQQTNSALSGQAEPKAALDAAVQQWEALTERIGRDKLQKLYREDLAI
ncbi:MAG TPA: extracellular solute-binding protein [Chloroflexota bacterium]